MKSARLIAIIGICIAVSCVRYDRPRSLSPTPSPISFSEHFALVRVGTNLGKAVVEMDPDTVAMSLNRAILEQPLLLMPTVITNSEPGGPEFIEQSFGTKRVFFKLAGNAMYLMESLKGQAVHPPFQPEKIIAEFPVLGATDDTITFDFKRGFDQIITEVPAGGSGPREERAATVLASYLRDPVTDGDLFGFYHVAKLSGERPLTVTLSYAFLPDRAPSFEAIKAPRDQSRLGYFLTPEIFSPGESTGHRLISRWDLSRPIFFAISPNTPTEFRDAVAQGIEAWNEAFGGHRVVVAVDAPEGTLIGDPRYNMVQWIEWNDKALARADWHVHPTTGEILHANVLLLSGWAVQTRGEAEQLLSQFDHVPGSSDAQEYTPLRYGLMGFDTAQLCDGFQPDASYQDVLQMIADGLIPEEAILPLMQRLVRTVVMHEVGHDLGLRHNFAGNLASQIPPSADNLDLIHLIVDQGREADAPLPSSSVMDYLTFVDDIRMDRPGDYDRAAIHWGYDATADLRESLWLPPFCTDEDTGLDADCQKRDAWADPLEWRIGAAAPRNVERLNRMFSGVLDGSGSETGNELQGLISDLEGMKNYVTASMRLRAFLGRSPEERTRRAGEGMAPYLWKGGVAAPVGALVNEATIAILNDLQSLAASGDAEAAAKIDLLRGVVMRMRDGIVSNLIGMLSGGRLIDRAATSPPPVRGTRLVVREAAIDPLAEGLVLLAANAGIDQWFADAEQHRREATVMIASLEADRGARFRTMLAEKLEENIRTLTLRIASSQNPTEEGILTQRKAFEEELQTLLTSPLPQPPPPPTAP